MHMPVDSAFVVSVFVSVGMCILMSWRVVQIHAIETVGGLIFVFFAGLDHFLLICVGFALFAEEKELSFIVLFNPIVFLLKQRRYGKGSEMHSRGCYVQRKQELMLMRTTRARSEGLTDCWIGIGAAIVRSCECHQGRYLPSAWSYAPSTSHTCMNSDPDRDNIH